MQFRPQPIPRSYTVPALPLEHNPFIGYTDGTYDARTQQFHPDTQTLTYRHFELSFDQASQTGSHYCSTVLVAKIKPCEWTVIDHSEVYRSGNILSIIPKSTKEYPLVNSRF